MIGIKINGRLGNQLFQYAFALATAKKLNTSFCLLPHPHQTNLLPQYFQLPPHQPTQWFRLQQKLRGNRQVEEQGDSLITDFPKPAIYKGYWQNEQYFEGHRKTLLQHLVLQPRVQQQFENHALAQLDYAKYIVLHVRLGDYQQWNPHHLGGANMSLPATYYTNALQALQHTTEPLVVVTDDPVAAKEKLPILRHAFFVHEHIMTDFQVMMQARKLVISNSSFAWWAAWLNPHQPQVIAPQHWLGFKVGKEYPAGIVSKKFMTVPEY